MKNIISAVAIYMLSLSWLDHMALGEEDGLELAASKQIHIFAGLKHQDGARIFKCVGIDALGRVVLLKKKVSDKPTDDINKLGHKFTAYLNAVIISKADGTLEFSFEPSTAGSSLTVVGKDGKIKEVSAIPKGISPDADGKGYFANIIIYKPDEVPIDDNIVKWMSLESVQGLGGH